MLFTHEKEGNPANFNNIDGPWRRDAKICALILIFIYFYNEIWIMTYIMKIVILAYIIF